MLSNKTSQTLLIKVDEERSDDSPANRGSQKSIPEKMVSGKFSQPLTQYLTTQDIVSLQSVSTFFSRNKESLSFSQEQLENSLSKKLKSLARNLYFKVQYRDQNFRHIIYINVGNDERDFGAELLAIKNSIETDMRYRNPCFFQMCARRDSIESGYFRNTTCGLSAIGVLVGSITSAAMCLSWETCLIVTLVPGPATGIVCSLSLCLIRRTYLGIQAQKDADELRPYLAQADRVIAL